MFTIIHSYFEFIFLSDKIKKRRYSLCYIEDFFMKYDEKRIQNDYE